MGDGTMSSATFKDDWEGTGSMESFVSASNRLFSAMNNIKILLPPDYGGIEPTFTFKPDALEFDFGDMLIFALNNVEWNLTGDADFVSNTVEVINGKLVISVEANDIP
jgi:hypothetical protein